MRSITYTKFIISGIVIILVIFISMLVRKVPGERGLKQESFEKRIKVLLDTDIGGDVDDVGALVILNNSNFPHHLVC